VGQPLRAHDVESQLDFGAELVDILAPRTCGEGGAVKHKLLGLGEIET